MHDSQARSGCCGCHVCGVDPAKHCARATDSALPLGGQPHDEHIRAGKFQVASKACLAQASDRGTRWSAIDRRRTIQVPCRRPPGAHGARGSSHRRRPKPSPRRITLPRGDRATCIGQRSSRVCSGPGRGEYELAPARWTARLGPLAEDDPFAHKARRSDQPPHANLRARAQPLLDPRHPLERIRRSPHVHRCFDGVAMPDPGRGRERFRAHALPPRRRRACPPRSTADEAGEWHVPACPQRACPAGPAHATLSSR